MLTETLFVAATVWYVPGWMRTQVPQEDVMSAMSNAFPKAEKSVQGVGNIHRAGGELPQAVATVVGQGGVAEGGRVGGQGGVAAEQKSKFTGLRFQMRRT